MFYSLARNVLFQMDPETAHRLSLQGLTRAAHCGLVKPGSARIVRPVTVMGISFANPLGIAPGADKNAEFVDGLTALGVGFVEVGTVTPRPQPGNPRPRVFRVVEQEAIINRLGFNGQGLEQFLKNLSQVRYQGPLGINISKNTATPNELAVEDTLTCLRGVYAHADYITVNISSPNSKNLRDLQAEAELDRLLKALDQERVELTRIHGNRVPIAIKIAPDLEPQRIDSLAAQLVERGMDAIVATNTTIDHSAIASSPLAQETGGLSGAPLFEKSVRVVEQLSRTLNGAIPIIGVGGITNAGRAHQMLDAGASLIQLYTGMIYHGPQLITDILDSFEHR